jgi:hypothetical protein
MDLTICSKQKEVIKVLNDQEHTEVFLGGAAGGTKSFTGCLWLILSCLKYQESRWFMARARLKNLKDSTLLTFFHVCKLLNLQPSRDYVYNSISGVVRFTKTNSEVYLKDLFLYPSDPEFVGLGSTEYCGGFIDEMGEITEQAYQIIRSRLRYKLTEFKIIPKLLMGSNPCKTFVYREFYKKWSNNQLEDYKVYIPAGVYDNPFISPHYIENLKKLDPVNKERLLNGNWEYDDDPAKLMDYDAINDMFTNDFIGKDENGKLLDEEKYLTADLAMQGRDNFIITSWIGLRGKIELVKHKSTGKEIEEDLKAYAIKKSVPRSQIIPDDGGMGSYLVSYMEGINCFNGAKKAYNKQFSNLRSECYFKLAELVNKRKIYIKCEDIIYKQKIIEELEQIKRDNIDKDDQKKKIISKDKIKENLGRSPDFSDVLMMRMLPLVGGGKADILTDDGSIFGDIQF